MFTYAARGEEFNLKYHHGSNDVVQCSTYAAMTLTVSLTNDTSGFQVTSTNPNRTRGFTAVVSQDPPRLVLSEVPYVTTSSSSLLPY